MNHNQNRRTPNHHHHKQNPNRIKGSNFFRAGQIFSVIYHLSLLVLIYLLVQQGESELALKVFVINAGIVIVAYSLATIERVLFASSGRKFRPGNRGHSNRRFNNNLQRSSS
jgi:hypothetical protein